MNFETYKLPVYWASYLINGDASGLADGEQEQIDAWCAETGVGLCVGCDDDIDEFCHRHDARDYALAGDCCNFTFEVLP